MSEPRYACWNFVLDHDASKTAAELSRAEFDALIDRKQFAVGPYFESFGDGYGHPYNPDRQIFGKLKDGRVVYAEFPGSREPHGTAATSERRA